MGEGDAVAADDGVGWDLGDVEAGGADYYVEWVEGVVGGADTVAFDLSDIRIGEVDVGLGEGF